MGVRKKPCDVRSMAAVRRSATNDAILTATGSTRLRRSRNRAQLSRSVL